MSKVIFVLTFKHPNLRDTVSKNVSHIGYISTRPGVDKSLTESDLRKELEKGVENISSNDETYVRYINERPRSHGLFGQDGIEDPKDVQEEVSNAKSYVWRGIISLKEDDAKQLGYLSKDKWQDMLRKKMPDLGNEMGINITNLRWVGAVHMERGHPHAHVMFWEKEPERTLGVVNTKTLDNIRKTLTDEIFEEERLELLNEKNAMRDLIRDLSQGDISHATKLLKEVKATGQELKAYIDEMNQEGVSPKLYSDVEQKLSEMINSLAENMTGKGRVNLKFMPEDIKQEVRSIADYLLQQPELSASLEKNLKAVEELTRMYTSEDRAINLDKNNYEYMINILARGLINNGLTNDKVVDCLKTWTNEQLNDIELPSDFTNTVLNKLNDEIENGVFFDKKFSGNINDINTISWKLMAITGQDTIDNIRNSIISNLRNNENKAFNELVDNKFITSENNIYKLSYDTTKLFEQYESLTETQKEMINVLGDGTYTAEDIINNDKIKQLVNTSSVNSKKLELGKYDSTVIREYFGKSSKLTFIELKANIERKYKSEDKRIKEYDIVTKRIKTLIEINVVEKVGDTYSFTQHGLDELNKVSKSFIFTSYDANVICNYIDKAGGNLTPDVLKGFLKNEYLLESELDRQYNYLIKRLNNNVIEGYISKDIINGEDCYKLNSKGIMARDRFLNPNVYEIKKHLEQFSNMNIVTHNEDTFFLNKNFKNIIHNKLLSSIKEGSYDQAAIQKEIDSLISSTIDKFDNMDTNYKSIKKSLKLKDIDNPIKKARINAYNDIRDRICQVILKGAVESQKDNIFYVDQELSEKAIDFIKDINSKINLVPEQTKVLNEIGIVLFRIGKNDDQIINCLKDFSKKENIPFTDESIQALVKNISEDVVNNDTEHNIEQNINVITSNKNVDYYLSCLKLSGYEEQEAFDIIKDVIKGDSKILDKQLNNLKDKGIFEKSGNYYKLTNKGIEEFLKVKVLDRAEKEIIKVLDDKSQEGPTEVSTAVNIKDLLMNGSILENLYDKDPVEFKIGKFDIKVREFFGDDNHITLKELEKVIYDKYTDEDLNVNIDRADNEYDALKNRIDKLTLYGYVEFNKKTGEYSFTNEGLNELSNVNDKMEFTRYDANVTLNYIDKAKDGILTAQMLHNTLSNEIVNQTAKSYYNKFMELLNTEQFQIAKKYISMDESGIITNTEDGKWLGIELNKVSKYFFKAKGVLTEDKLKDICIKEFGQVDAELQYKRILLQINKQVDKGYINRNQDNGTYKINSTINDISHFLYQIYKEGGSLNKSELKEILERNILNKDAESQFKYLIKRLNNLKKLGYLQGVENEYKFTDAGIEKRADLLTPERDLLRNKLSYMEKLGFIKNINGNYQITDNYYKYMDDIATAKEMGETRNSDYLSKDIANQIDRTQDMVDVHKIERYNTRIVIGKYINDEYQEIKTDYESMRSYCGVTDTLSKTIKNLSTTLLVSGVSLEDTKVILQQWNTNNNCNIDNEKLNEIIDKAHDVVKENNLWDKTTIISVKDWKAMFESLGVDEDDIPRWIYKCENWETLNHGIGLASIINDIWKSAWRELEKQRMQAEAQAEMMKKHQIMQQAISQNKEAIKEQIIKNKDRNSLYREDELGI